MYIQVDNNYSVCVNLFVCNLYSIDPALLSLITIMRSHLLYVSSKGNIFSCQST